MKSKLLQNLSANALQLVINQFFGLAIFYILSTALSKDAFGQLNLALAILLAAFNILSFGIDQVIVKKIAAGFDATSVLSLYVTHVLITGLVFYGLITAGYFLFPNHPAVYNLLLLIGLGKLMIYFSTPFKQAANGMELFKLLAYLSVISNFIRAGCLIIAALLQLVNLPVVVAIFIAGDVLELGIGLLLFKKTAKVPFTIKLDKINYACLLRESLPQTGVVIITSALARFDWIFIGFILSAVKLAEYSFAYKIFEIATLPLAAIAPLLIPRFTKMFKQGDVNTDNLILLIRLEFIIAAFIALTINICWVPVIGWLTAGKYGAVNVTTIFILTLCTPLLYLENVLWTIFFAEGRTKMILHAFIVTLAVNIIGDIVLIPIFKNEGAAVAFLLACMAQIIFYLLKNNIADLGKAWQPLIICTACALCSGYVARTFFSDVRLALPTAILIFIMLLILTFQLKLSDGKALKSFFSR